MTAPAPRQLAPQRNKAGSNAPRSALRRWLGGTFWTLVPLVAGLYIASGLFNSRVADRLQNIVFDQYQRWHPRPWNPNGPVRVILIDDHSIAKHGQWPWPRETFAKLIDRLNAAGAAVIAFDMVFAEQDRLARSAILKRLPDVPERKALEKALQDKGMLDETGMQKSIAKARVVLGYVLTPTGNAQTIPVKWGVATAGDDPRPFLPSYSRALAPLAPIARAAKGIGSFNMATDQDLLVRRVPMFFHLGTGKTGPIVPSLSAEALRVAQGAGTYILKSSNASGESGFGEKTGVIAAKIGAFEVATGKDGTVRVHYSGTQKARHIPAWKILDGSFNPKQIEGRIILVGSGASALADFRATPLEQSVAGVDAHAEVIEQIVAGVKLTRPDYARGLELWAMLLGALLLLFLIARTRALTAGLCTLALTAFAGAASWLAFRYAGHLFDPLLPGATWLATGAIGLAGAYWRTEREKQFVRTAFSRYLSPAVVERIAGDPTQLSLGGETREVTILFSDVRAFTTRSESLDAEGVVNFLNAVHTPFTGRVLAEQGTIDKYIGDGLMAFWNAPLQVAGHANHACAAALAMLDSVPEIDAKLAGDAAARGQAHMPLRIGIGLNTGEVFVGNMGSDQRFDYSIVGDPVNVAARLETSTKEFAVPILVSQSTRDQASDYVFVDLGSAGLKGKTTETSVFALHGHKKDAGADFDAFLELHAKVITAAGENRNGLGAAIEAARVHPEAKPYLTFYSLLENAGSLN